MSLEREPYYPRLGLFLTVAAFLAAVCILSVFVDECHACVDGGYIVEEVTECEVTYHPGLGYYIDGRFLSCEGYSVDDCYLAAEAECADQDAGPDSSDAGPDSDETEEIIMIYSRLPEVSGCNTMAGVGGCSDWYQGILFVLIVLAVTLLARKWRKKDETF